MADTNARRVGRLLERRGLLEREAENSHMAGEAMDEGFVDPLRGHSITYRNSVGPQQARTVFTLQTLPARDAPLNDGVGKVTGFSLRAGIAARGAAPHRELDGANPCEIVAQVLSKELAVDAGENFADRLQRSDEVCAQRERDAKATT